MIAALEETHAFAVDVPVDAVDAVLLVSKKAMKSILLLEEWLMMKRPKLIDARY